MEPSIYTVYYLNYSADETIESDVVGISRVLVLIKNFPASDLACTVVKGSSQPPMNP
jgi:hypothetical protein